MKLPAFATSKLIVVLFVGLLAAGASIWGLTASKQVEAQPAVQVPKEFTVDALRSASVEQGFDTFRKAIEREDLTEEQRRQIMENGREVMEQRMDERMNEYFSCPKEDRKRILDKHLDEFEKLRQEREAREQERDKMSEEEREKERERWRKIREGRPEPTQAERKARVESRSSDKSAQRMAYRQAMRDRMKERGIDLPRWGGPGGPGGPGGRRGGG
jgi:hypothetical protein